MLSTVAFSISFGYACTQDSIAPPDPGGRHALIQDSTGTCLLVLGIQDTVPFV